MACSGHENGERATAASYCSGVMGRYEWRTWRGRGVRKQVENGNGCWDGFQSATNEKGIRMVHDCVGKHLRDLVVWPNHRESAPAHEDASAIGALANRESQVLDPWEPRHSKPSK